MNLAVASPCLHNLVDTNTFLDVQVEDVAKALPENYLSDQTSSLILPANVRAKEASYAVVIGVNKIEISKAQLEFWVQQLQAAIPDANRYAAAELWPKLLQPMFAHLLVQKTGDGY